MLNQTPVGLDQIIHTFGSLDDPQFEANHIVLFNLPYPLLADPDASIAKAYGVGRLGGVLGGWLPTKRVTFVIDKEGVVRHVISSEFNIDKHIDEAIDALQRLQAA